MENKTKTKRPPRKRRSLSVAERKKQLHLRIGLSLAGIFLVFFLFLAPFGPHLLFGKGRAVNLSDSVLQYQALVDQYCEEYSSRLSPRSCWPSCSRKAPVLWPTSCRPQKALSTPGMPTHRTASWIQIIPSGWAWKPSPTA